MRFIFVPFRTGSPWRSGARESRLREIQAGVDGGARGSSKGEKERREKEDREEEGGVVE